MIILPLFLRIFKCLLLESIFFDQPEFLRDSGCSVSSLRGGDADPAGTPAVASVEEEDVWSLDSR